MSYLQKCGLVWDRFAGKWCAAVENKTRGHYDCVADAKRFLEQEYDEGGK